MSDRQTEIITRGDDCGSSHSANLAILDAFQNGLLRNTSVIVPGPWFEEAAEMFKDIEGLCIGLHATITSEWHEVRWGPISGIDKVPSLVREDGSFFESSLHLQPHNPDYDQILLEIKAQLDLARSKGLNIQYIDEHMGFSWYDGLEPLCREFAASEGLIWHEKVLEYAPRLSFARDSFSDPIDALIATLESVQAGQTYLLLTHPAYDNEEMHPLSWFDNPPGVAARVRDEDRRMLTDPRVIEFFERNNFEAVRYTDIAGP